MSEEAQTKTFDIRSYIGILLFRWKIVVVCFLWAILGGVLFLQLSPKIYKATASIMIYRDRTVELLPVARSDPWRSGQVHSMILNSEDLQRRVAQSLLSEYGERIGGLQAMMLPISVSLNPQVSSSLLLVAKCPDAEYAEKFLDAMQKAHELEWRRLARERPERAGSLLQTELDRLAGEIDRAENDVLEFKRLHDMARVQARGAMEGRFLGALISRRSQLITELMLLEAQFPELEKESALVLSHANRLTRSTSGIEVLPPDMRKEDMLPLPEALTAERVDAGTIDNLDGWQALQVRLAKLKEQETQLASTLAETHPQVREVRSEIEKIEDQLKEGQEIEFQRMKDRYRALLIQLNAVETAEYQWQAKDLLASQREGEYKRRQSVLARYEENFNTLYTRLHDMRVDEELDSDVYRVLQGAARDPNPVWPNATKIMMMVIVLGLGSGFGLVFLAQFLDNKVQTIRDVEELLGVPFLGGIPYWIHSGLEKTIRPIVTEEHASGAIEAYRALRTTVLSELAKINEKIIFFTSADAKEGKTLTSLNLAIMIAQMNKRILLIDMDLRRGRLHKSLGLTRDTGMTDVLTGKCRVRDAIQTTRVDGLDFIPSGHSIENPSEALEASDVMGLLVDLREDYDYIVLDTSPVLRVTDTVILATQGVGVVVYVARVNHTPKPLIKYSLNMLKDARILGVIMNSIEMHRISSIYYAYQYPNYAYYSNAYAYGYDYYTYGDRTGRPRRKRWYTPIVRRWRNAVDRVRRGILPTE
jgi:capsular exopolysaccharide synthesis family protein